MGRSVDVAPGGGRYPPGRRLDAGIMCHGCVMFIGISDSDGVSYDGRGVILGARGLSKGWGG